LCLGGRRVIELYIAVHSQRAGLRVHSGSLPGTRGRSSFTEGRPLLALLPLRGARRRASSLRTIPFYSGDPGSPKTDIPVRRELRDVQRPLHRAGGQAQQAARPVRGHRQQVLQAAGRLGRQDRARAQGRGQARARAPAGRPGLMLALAAAAAIQWIALPGGLYSMGSDRWSDSKPVHQVQVKPFEMAKTPVTNKQYQACVAAGACVGLSTKCATAPFTGDDQPVVCATWDMAAAFAHWAGGRLPSEAEWEYAARSGGKTQAFPWGDAPATCARAVLSENGYGCGKKTSAPVCSRPKGNTRQGLCDMAGEVYEWVQDAYHETYDGAPSDG